MICSASDYESREIVRLDGDQFMGQPVFEERLTQS